MAPLAPPSLSAVASPLTRVCMIGASPKSTPVAMATPNVKSSTNGSTATSLVRGRLVGYARISACTPTRASNTPSAPPAIDNSTPSVMNCRSSRPRLAPSAVRTANSRWRRLGARQQQVGEIRAGDEQHEADGRLQHPDRAARAAEHLVLQRLHLKEVATRSQPAGGRRGRLQSWLDADALAPVLA